MAHERKSLICSPHAPLLLRVTYMTQRGERKCFITSDSSEGLYVLEGGMPFAPRLNDLCTRILDVDGGSGDVEIMVYSVRDRLFDDPQIVHAATLARVRGVWRTCISLFD